MISVLNSEVICIYILKFHLQILEEVQYIIKYLVIYTFEIESWKCNNQS